MSLFDSRSVTTAFSDTCRTRRRSAASRPVRARLVAQAKRCGLFSGGPGPRAVCGTSHLTPVPGANPERTGSSGASPLFVAKLFYPGVPLLPPPFFSSKQRSADERPAPRETLPGTAGGPSAAPAATKLPRRLLAYLTFPLESLVVVAPGLTRFTDLHRCDRRRVALRTYTSTLRPGPPRPRPDTCVARAAHTRRCIAAARPHTSARRGTRAAVHAVSTAQRPSGPLPCGTLAHPSGRLCPPPSVPILTPLAAAAHSARPRRSRAARCSLLRRSPSACPLTSSSLRATLTLSATQLGSSWPWTRSSLRSLSGA